MLDLLDEAKALKKFHISSIHRIGYQFRDPRDLGDLQKQK